MCTFAFCLKMTRCHYKHNFYLWPNLIRHLHIVLQISPILGWRLFFALLLYMYANFQSHFNFSLVFLALWKHVTTFFIKVVLCATNNKQLNFVIVIGFGASWWQELGVHIHRVLGRIVIISDHQQIAFPHLKTVLYFFS